MKIHHLVYGFATSMIGMVLIPVFFILAIFDSIFLYLTFVAFVVMFLGAPYFWFVVPEREKERAKYHPSLRNQVSQRFCVGCGYPLIVGGIYCISCGRRRGE